MSISCLKSDKKIWCSVSNFLSFVWDVFAFFVVWDILNNNSTEMDFDKNIYPETQFKQENNNIWHLLWHLSRNNFSIWFHISTTSLPVINVQVEVRETFRPHETYWSVEFWSLSSNYLTTFAKSNAVSLFLNKARSRIEASKNSF